MLQEEPKEDVEMKVNDNAPAVKEEHDEQMAEGEGGPEPEGEYQVMDAIDDSEVTENDHKSDGML